MQEIKKPDPKEQFYEDKKIMHQRLTKIWILIFLSSCLISPFWVAAQSSCGDNPPVCQATPASMNLYLEFQNQILGLLQSNPFETVKETVNLPEWWLFTNQVLTLQGLEEFNESLIGKTSRILWTAIENLLISHATTLLLFTIWNENALLFDPLMSFTILFHDRPIVRDRAKILQIDSILQHTIYTTGKTGKTLNTIKNSEKINALIQNYIDQKLLSSASILPDKIKYWDLFSELGIINWYIKSFLARKTTKHLYEKKGLLRFSDERIEQLDQDYACTRLRLGFKCNADLDEGMNNIKHLRANTQKTWKSSATTIKAAIERRNKAWNGYNRPSSSKSNELTSEELELLREVYNIDTSKFSTKEQEGLLAMTENTQQQRQKVKKHVQKARKSVKKFVKDITTKKENEEKKDKKPEENTEDSEWKQLTEIEIELKNKYNPNLYQNLMDDLAILDKAKNDIVSTTKYNDSLALSSRFGEFSHKIQKIKEVIGDKKNWTRKNLKDVCDYQCSNKNSICYVQ